METIKILLAEDNPGDVDLTIEAFEDGKISNEIYTVKNGQEVLDFLRQKGKHKDAPRPDIILLDINMPVMSGTEALKKIKKDADLRSIPVVMLTSSSQHKDIVESYNLHANCFITKPVDFDKFVEIVKQIENFWFTVVKLPNKDSF